MNTSMVKSYDYDEVMDLTKTGGEMDAILTELQGYLKELRVKVNELETLYHGKGVNSTIYKAYKNYYETIQKMWGLAFSLHEQENYIYANAKNDKIMDEGM